MSNSINWFAIPTSDFERALDFYNALFDNGMHRMNMGGNDLAFFPAEQGSVSGHIFYSEDFKPSDKGPLLYLNGGDDLQPLLDKVEAAGGKIIAGKRQVTPEIGYVAEFIDSEGNKIALHSPN